MPQEDPVQPKNKAVWVGNQWRDFSGRANYPDSSQGVPPTADEALRSQVDGMTWDGRKGFFCGCPASFPPRQCLLTQSTFMWLWCFLWERYTFWRWICLPWPSCFCQRQHCGLCRYFIYCRGTGLLMKYETRNLFHGKRRVATALCSWGLSGLTKNITTQKPLPGGMVSEDSCHPERMELFLTGCCI